MLRHALLTGILVGALASGVALAQTTTGQTPPAQPEKNAPAQKAPGASRAKATGNALGTVRIPRTVLANGQPLKAGTYQVRLTDEQAKPVPAGQTPESELWVEFVQGGQQKGREVASVISNDELKKFAEDKQSPPAPGQPKVQMLKGGDYVRVWFSRGGSSYLIHLPLEGEAGKKG